VLAVLGAQSDAIRNSMGAGEALVATEQQDDAIVASAYGDVQGIPAIFPRIAFPGLLNLRGDTGARALIANAPCAVVSVPFEGGEIDIDLPQDLEQIR
jgi:molybdenum cofactor cytidylyltransferase